MKLLIFCFVALLIATIVYATLPEAPSSRPFETVIIQPPPLAEEKSISCPEFVPYDKATDLALRENN